MRFSFKEPEWHAFLAFAVFLMVLGLCLLTQPRLTTPVFSPPLSSQPASIKISQPWVKREFLPIAAPSVHAPTLAELPDGRLAAAWFAGSREGADDVRIVMSIRGTNPLDEESELPHKLDSAMPELRWQAPKIIANREQTIRDTHRSTRKLGNPVLFVDGPRLHLFYVSASIGGWAGSSINHRYSDDQGEHWSNAIKLISSPFLNASTLVRTPPIKLADGSLALPVYHELIHKHGEWLRVSPQGDVMSKTRMPHPRPTLQPAIITFDAQKAVALLRDAGGGKGHIQLNVTEDGGRHWHPGPALPLSNPNSSIATLRLHDGRLLLAANPGEGRHILELWLSSLPNGSTPSAIRWEKITTISDEVPLRPRKGASPRTPPDAASPPATNTGGSASGSGPAVTDEISYPALLQARDGTIHLAYTWHRQRIQMMSFNPAWLDANKTSRGPLKGVHKP